MYCRWRRKGVITWFNVVNIKRFEVFWLCTRTCTIRFKQGRMTPKRRVWRYGLLDTKWSSLPDLSRLRICRRGPISPCTVMNVGLSEASFTISFVLMASSLIGFSWPVGQPKNVGNICSGQMSIWMFLISVSAHCFSDTWILQHCLVQPGKGSFSVPY
jgi:hypothetical protein